MIKISYQNQSFEIVVAQEGPTLLPDGRCVAFNGVLAPGVVQVVEEPV